MIYKTCCFIARQNCPGCDENVLMDDAKHKIPTVGCQDITTKEIVDEHFSVAADMVTDTVAKNMLERIGVGNDIKCGSTYG